MFRLITGVPGAGKTLNTVHNLKDTKDRPVYYHGIPALNLPWQEIQNPKQWHLEVPNGAIVIIDEAQKHFPARGVSKGEPPKAYPHSKPIDTGGSMSTGSPSIPA